MKKIIAFLLLTVIVQQITAQSETFDITTYTPPKGFKKEEKTGGVVYSQANDSTGKFCAIIIFASTAGTGDVAKDFKLQWDELAVKKYVADANPTTEKAQTPDGWKTVTGASLIKIQGTDAYVVLTVFSWLQKRVTVISTLNDQAYLLQLDTFLETVRFNKNKNKITNNDNMQTATQSKTFGSVSYFPPSGWKVEKYSDGDILTPMDIPQKEFMEIWVMPSMSYAGTMEQALQKSYDETVLKLKATKMNEVNGGNYTITPQKESFRGWEYIRCSGGIHLGDGEYPPEFGLDIFVIKLNDRLEQVAVLKKRSNCDFSSYYLTDKLNYYNDVENFLFSLQFPDWKEPAFKPGTLKGDGIVGVWQGIGLSVGLAKPGAQIGAELKVKDAIFFSNGQVYFGTKFPTEGLDELNTWVKAEQNRRDWGTYTFSNGKGVIQLPYGEIPLVMQGNKLVLTTNKTDHSYIKINGVDGAVFNGTYSFSSKNFFGQETGKTPTIHFTTDGKFNDNGAISILNHDLNECVNAAKQPGTGTYEIKSHTVIFKYSDGRKIKIAFIGSDFDKNNQSPATLTLSFNEDMLIKE